ncbi:hypothetical protein X797_003182 [Metarhizium robertsii]|uniref:Uncharacterized protein n=1 Tax=Metarhizium robertsii TaxID=568076 RepID=A0A0A1UZC8_9HYPO|nr:hypothetical protein X797_003182 [Metarhizium robertsii]
MLRSGLRAHLCSPVCFMPCCCPSFSVPSAPHRKTGQQPPWAIVLSQVSNGPAKRPLRQRMGSATASIAKYRELVGGGRGWHNVKGH